MTRYDRSTVYSAAGKGTVKRFITKKIGSLVFGGGGAAAMLLLFLVIVVFVVISGFFGWFSPFKYGLAGEAPDTEHNAETKAEVIDGYTLMVKNYLDVTQAYYYLNYGDWYAAHINMKVLKLILGRSFRITAKK